MKKIHLASNNRHKAKEFEQIINSIIPGKINLILPEIISIDKFDVDETGSSFIENSFIKAKAFFEKFNLPVISDDSGLEVNSLNGEPGINSARYAGEHGNDELNRKKLLTNLKDFDDKQANFIAVLCYFDGNEPIFFEGKVFGKIIDTERGNGGFGYDPIFMPDGYDITFSEMEQEEKNRISHRSLAIQRFCKYLEEDFQTIKNH
jgi:XTP/dITP diphosphohydrolase